MPSVTDDLVVDAKVSGTGRHRQTIRSRSNDQEIHVPR